MNSSSQDLWFAKRRRLGAELRRLREQAGVSGRTLAGQLGISQSTVSRIESGATLPTSQQITEWAARTETTASAREALSMLTDAAYAEEYSWDDVQRELGHLQDSIYALEVRAHVKLTYEPSVVPGLLQTAEYSRQLFQLFQPPYPKEGIPSALNGRLQRQALLFDADRQFEFLVTEAALRLRLGSASMMAAQLDRIATLSTLENVDIGLIPSDAQAWTHVPHGFNIFDFADGDGPDALVLVEGVHAQLNVGSPDDVELYRRQWSLLAKSALFGADAIKFLDQLTRDMRDPSPPGRRAPGPA